MQKLLSFAFKGALSTCYNKQYKICSLPNNAFLKFKILATEKLYLN